MSELDKLPEIPSGRAHCYVFVHEALPSVLFRDREKLVDYLRGPHAQEALDTLWKGVGRVVVEEEMGEEVSGTGLTAESVDGGGWRGVVIHMPKAEELGDSELVLMAVPNLPLKAAMWQLFEKKEAPLTRLFMLKLLQLPREESPGYHVCEISPLLGAVTTGYTCDTNVADFVREVVDALDLEA